MTVAGPEPEIAWLCRIEGRVQGVWYRAWAEGEAKRRHLRGWVRNRRDGSVEALFVGPQAAIEAMLAACWEGPPAAKVERIQHVAVTDFPEGDFQQRPDF